MRAQESMRVKNLFQNQIMHLSWRFNIESLQANTWLKFQYQITPEYTQELCKDYFWFKIKSLLMKTLDLSIYKNSDFNIRSLPMKTFHLTTSERLEVRHPNVADQEIIVMESIKTKLSTTLYILWTVN